MLKEKITLIKETEKTDTVVFNNIEIQKLVEKKLKKKNQDQLSL